MATLDGEIVSPKCAFKAADRAFRGAWWDAFNRMSLSGSRGHSLAAALVPQKHIARAFKGASGGADRSADDRTHGTGSSGPTLAPGLHPRDRAGYRASIPRRLRRCG